MSLDKLSKHHSWKLECLSGTIPSDVTRGEAETVATLFRKRGRCYRCRIGKGRYFFGETADEAIEAAVKGQKKTRTR